MSRQLISRSPDLTRLQEEGYEIDVVSNFLVVRHVPYVNAEQQVAYGVLLCPLVLQNDQTGPPTDHTMFFEGTVPHRADGVQLQILCGQVRQQHAESLFSDMQFSRKPKGETESYTDFYHKTVTYVEFLSKSARDIDPAVTARTYLHIPTDTDEDSVFRYGDNASARANIQLATDKLKAAGPLAIVGLGGTGTYILDLVAKTPVSQIHLFDGDRFSQHNAFRSPGAPAGTDLDGAPPKVAYFGAIYDRMRKGIEQHNYFIDEQNVGDLTAMSFVFIAIDDGHARRLIVDTLTAAGVPFIDVGMGIYEQDAELGGQVRTTTVAGSDLHGLRRRLPIKDPDPGNEYRANIQIADLNALNAVFAVLKWKKLVGFYEDTDLERHSVYVIGGNRLVNEDHDAQD